jgi:hypothetical protein
MDKNTINFYFDVVHELIDKDVPATVENINKQLGPPRRRCVAEHHHPIRTNPWLGTERPSPTARTRAIRFCINQTRRFTPPLI